MWAVISAALVIVCITRWVYSWYNPRCYGKLPPGSMGLPLLGESFQFFAPNTSSDVPPFIKTRMKKYGPIFKTSLVTRPVIVSTDSDLNYFIFQQEGKLFQSWYPDTFTEIFGRQNVGSLHGFMYKYLKNMMLNLFGPESLKKMLPEVEQAARTKFDNWCSKDSAGWAVMVCPPAVHLNPDKYKDPLAFNPWRWDGIILNGATKSFMAFGGGMRFCVGTEFTKVQMAVFLHCFVTKYKWKKNQRWKYSSNSRFTVSKWFAHSDQRKR